MLDISFALTCPTCRLSREMNVSFSNRTDTPLTSAVSSSSTSLTPAPAATPLSLSLSRLTWMSCTPNVSCSSCL